MKFLTLVFLLFSISLQAQENLEGVYLGESRGGLLTDPAVRIYIHPDQNKPGEYYLVLAEYHNLFTTVGPRWTISKGLPFLKPTVGHLTKIAKRTTAHKLVPTDNDMIFDVLPLKVTDDYRIVPVNIEKPAKFKLRKNQYRAEGATIKQNKKAGIWSDITITYPEKRDPPWSQIVLAHLAYTKANLKSTWRKEFLGGPYLSAYERNDDEVLTLTSNGDQHYAKFFIDGRAPWWPLDVRFTNKKSAEIKGEYEMIEAVDGMFVFKPSGDDKHEGAQHLKGRIGLFIDIFDATEMGQDVVELFVIDPTPGQDKDLLMYFEHPENGEGEVKEEKK